MKSQMLLAGMISISTMAQADVITATLSNQTTRPTSNVGVYQAVAYAGNDMGIQARNRGGTDIRSVTQTFKWDSDLSMDGLGLMVSDEPQQDKDFTTSQIFTLDIQLLDSVRKVVSTVATATFTITPSNVVRGSYIYIDLATNIPMIKDSVYGLNLRTSDAQNNRLYLARGGDAIANYNFAGQQLTNNDPVATGTAYTNAGWDIAFYTTTTPVPETASLGLLACFGLPLLMTKIR